MVVMVVVVMIITMTIMMNDDDVVISWQQPGDIFSFEASCPYSAQKNV